MNLPVVFNHHALPFDSRDKIEVFIVEFIKTLVKLKSFGFSILLLDQSQDKSLFHIKLAPQYYWQDWYNRTKTQIELKDVVSRFKSLIVNSPLLPLHSDQSDKQKPPHNY